MSTLLEITSDDINQLNDADLRTLIGLLCEADYRLAGLPTKGITWGGHQDARDGGLDVVVRDDVSPPSNSFIPRKATGFQVKKPDMPKTDIVNEMRPKGVLREEIQNLIQEQGAYIIVSSSGSTSSTALKSRQEAMRGAVQSEKDHLSLHVEFLDRGRIATWVRMHPAMILWVRSKIGRQLKGWQSYGNWSKAPGGLEEEYLLDDGLRLHNGTARRDKTVPIKEGLLEIRAALSNPGSSVRLTGLSGVGKTRVVQALFDERLETQALNPSQAFYTDMSDSPDPDPRTFAEQLIANGARAILVVDNCPPDLHRRLTLTCARSSVSLLTVEYDVRDHLPEETSVFRLEPASEEIIEKLIRRRFSHIEQIDARTIAKFSSGNARVAIALATTVQRGETLSGFRDEDLFERLFWQRHGTDTGLLSSAEVCSLVYSFEGTDTDSENSELGLLASLIGKSGAELYRDVAILRERDLVQSRDVWRAVLPHAIANRLADRALSAIPKNTIADVFLHAPERLLKSFTRRLCFLHDSDIAVSIVDEWLHAEGWLGKENCNFNKLGMEVFNNIAPVSPEKVLAAIERAADGDNGSWFTSRENGHYSEFVTLLRHLAYDTVFFNRSVKLLCRFALSESPEENQNSIRSVLKELFYITLSGTHAPLEMRAKLIEELVDSEDSKEQELGLVLLDAALEAGHFSSSHTFGFGARPRDYGYRPRKHEEVVQWYETYVEMGTRLAVSNKPIAIPAKRVLANNLRGLWTSAGVFDAVEKSVKQILAQMPWNEGWIAVRGLIHYNGRNTKNSTPEDIERVNKLALLLKPTDLLHRARAYALSDQRFHFDLDEDFDDEEAGASWRRAEDTTRKIGAQVAQDAEVLSALLPDVVSTQNTRLYSFGRGLADGCTDKKQLWDSLRAQLAKAPAEKRQINVLLGFLASCAEIAPEFYNKTLDTLINDELLGTWLPFFQTTAPVDKQGLDRLHQSLDKGIAQIHTYRQLAYGRTHETLTDDELADIVRKIFSKAEGQEVAIEILSMRLHGQTRDIAAYSKNLVKAVQQVLAEYSFPDERTRRHNNDDYELARLAEFSFADSEGANACTALCQNLAEAIESYHVYSMDYPQLLNALARAQPTAFMDVFLIGESAEGGSFARIFSDDLERDNNPLNQISEEAIISWCEVDPVKRYSIAADALQTYTGSVDDTGLLWKSVALALIDKAPDLNSVLNNIAESLIPNGWMGSLAELLQKRSMLYEQLYEHKNPEVAAWARDKNADLQKRIKSQREYEDRETRTHNESFE